MILNKFPDKQLFINTTQTANAIPLCTQVLADTETSVPILQKFYNKDQELFLLESVEDGENWARYSFFRGFSIRLHPYFV
jgi:anthranilate synthase component I